MASTLVLFYLQSPIPPTTPFTSAHFFAIMSTVFIAKNARAISSFG